MSTNAPLQKDRPLRGQPLALAKRLAQILLLEGLVAVLLFGLAGRIQWTGAWLMLGAFLTLILINAFLFLPQDTGLVEERTQIKANVKGWDRWLMPLIWVFGHVLAAVTAALDQRFSWSNWQSVVWMLFGLLVFASAYALIDWAVLTNRFFSSYVRIQEDRGHQVISSGPYRYVRHPGYLGMALMYLSLPLLLNSYWAYLPVLVALGLLVTRTAMEDRTLQRELPGYIEFAARTRYRLLPGIW